jgi:hypothetical protein
VDPNLVEELLLKKKWNNAQKNPERSMRNQSIDNTSYWQSLNHLPPKGIDNIVTNKILKYDQQGCKTILDKIY